MRNHASGFRYALYAAAVPGLLLAGCSPGDDAGGNGAAPSPVEANSLPSLGETDDLRVVAWETVEGLPASIARFETVFWEPDDTVSLRRLIRETPLVEDRRVLEIGTGTGLVSLCCLQTGAERVVATDINPSAVENARYNAGLLGADDRFEARLVSPENPGAYSVVADGETFDVIISNPPWEDAPPESIADYALYDENFALLKSIVAGLDEHLAHGGRALLAYGCKTAVLRLLELAERHGWRAKILDDRELEDLPEVFLPGMLIELRRFE